MRQENVFVEEFYCFRWEFLLHKCRIVVEMNTDCFVAFMLVCCGIEMKVSEVARDVSEKRGARSQW